MSYRRDLWAPRPLDPRQCWGRSFLPPRQRGLEEPCGRRTGPLLPGRARSEGGLALHCPGCALHPSPAGSRCRAQEPYLRFSWGLAACFLEGTGLEVLAVQFGDTCPHSFS